MANKAKYYIYKNLHTGTWSVKYKGKVIAHPTHLIAHKAETKVNQKTRLRVIEEKKKYVHAYIVADSYSDLSDLTHMHIIMEKNFKNRITYNPYKNKSFMCCENQQRMLYPRHYYMDSNKGVYYDNNWLDK